MGGDGTDGRDGTDGKMDRWDGWDGWDQWDQWDPSLLSFPSLSSFLAGPAYVASGFRLR